MNTKTQQEKRLVNKPTPSTVQLKRPFTPAPTKSNGMETAVQPKTLSSQTNLVGRAQRTHTLQQKVGNTRVGRMMNPAPVQRQENSTGLPETLKSGIEALSGLSMDDVQVHYNSDKPAQLQALAYTQGTDIHVAPRQEKHLAHEAWHAVQQRQGRVRPTIQTKGALINNDAALENEADVMGTKAMQLQKHDQDIAQKKNSLHSTGNKMRLVTKSAPIQRFTDEELNQSAKKQKDENPNLSDFDCWVRGIEHLIAYFIWVALGRTGSPNQHYDWALRLRDKANHHNFDPAKITPEQIRAIFGGGFDGWEQRAIQAFAPPPQRVPDPEIVLRGTIKAATKVFFAQDDSEAGVFDNPTRREFSKLQDGKLYFDDDIVYVSVADVDLDRHVPVRDRPLFDGIPHPKDIIQGQLGDCFLLAAAATIADRNYKKIEEMFQDNGDTVTVRLFDVTEKANKKRFAPRFIIVDKSVVKKSDGTEAYAQKHLWVQMLEKAYAAANIDPNSELLKPMQGPSYKNYAEGGTLAFALQVLLGEEAEFESIYSGYGRGDSAVLPWSSTERKNYREGNIEQLVSWSIFKQDKGNVDIWMKFVTFDETYNGPIDKMFNQRTEFDDPDTKKIPYYDKEIRLHHFQELFDSNHLDATVAAEMIAWLDKSGFYPGKKGEYRDTGGKKEAKYSGEQLKAFLRIKKAIDENRPIAIKTKPVVAPKAKQDNASPTGEVKGKGFLGGHFYAVLDYDDTADIIKDVSLKWVKVRHPWGYYGIKNDYNFAKSIFTRAKVEKGNGEFWLELNDVTKFFMTVHTGSPLARPTPPQKKM